ncbi:alpha-2-macroglobulin family protein [Tenacibaculum sp. IB213877]|uniref:alpha-2-macroglobulin family protein n=1 Tax=Tenacibaculum sp. IB213877 TaxID=3097351 RepID=UPI002A5A4BBB|nr:MG2 domain-containing protein [Tenacibaculum sp. IB213877]MDY0780106.1 MG2 domain-containing protein [Tenacibaculum sp. IB213877]
MKNFTLFLLMILFSTTVKAQNNYPDLWEKVHKFELDNLPKSALQVVEEIYQKAEKEHNAPQLIKTLFYKSKFSLILEEGAQLKIINEFKKQIAESKFPTNRVLENILANLYWQYFNQNRWQFYNRTKTENKVDSTDFRTWDLQTLFAEIHQYYQASLTDKNQLQKIDVHQFGDILQLAKDSKKYRPTLYDFLAHNALDFYKTNEISITKPAYQFKIDDENYLSNAYTFNQLKVQSKDSLSLQFNALKIYQSLTDFHLKNKNLNALTDVDLQRLEFVNQHATFSNKQKVLLETLATSKSQHKNHEVSSLYSYEIAKIYNQQANTYVPKTNEENRFKNVDALQICNEVIKQFPNSEGAKKCAVLKQQILAKSVQIITEEHIPSLQYSKTLVTYKNLDNIFFTAYKIDEKDLEKLDKIYKDDERAKFISNLQKVTSWSSTLKNENDYQQHSTEIITPKLERGLYLLVGSVAEEFKNGIFSTTSVQVTDLALISRNKYGENTYQVVDRNTGKPLVNAKAHLTNDARNRYDKVLDRHFVTDKNGGFTFSANNNYYNIKATVNYKDDKATFGRYYVNKKYKNDSPERVYTQTFLFTDRSIYRPGQTVHFKGISMETFKNKSEVIVDENVFITFRDVNGQIIKELELKTNEFGSFSSTLTIPNTGLTGYFSIEARINNRSNSTSISVEEYKRPKFQTDFKPVSETYKINDTVTINGFAKSYSGANITDAKVVYRVHRKVQYPRWWYWSRPSFFSEPQEITHGETITNEKGEFTIDFKALADESVAKENQPIFTYEITADVTDINGETRSATTTVKVGYHALLASIEMDDKLDKTQKTHSLKIDTKNLNGEFVPAKGTIKIYKLQAPNAPLRKRPWNAPYYQTIPESEFKQKFPHEAYKNEHDVTTWKKGKLVFEATFNTDKEKEIALKSIKKWSSGKYVAELETKDKFQQKVTDVNYFSVFSLDDKLPADNELVKVTTDKESYKIGDNAKITVSSNSENITVMVFVEKQGKIIASHYIPLSKSSKTITIPVTQKDEGGFGITYHYVNYNSFESGSINVKVPYPKTDLEIITKTFRDKLQPGSEETWSFTVKGSKKDQVTAELLASMYDASLDQFKPHQWNFNPINRPEYQVYNNTTANQSFGNTYFRIYNQNQDHFDYPYHQYDQLNWFGFYLSKQRIMIRGNASISKKLEGRVAGVAPQAISVEEDEAYLLEETVVVGYAKEASDKTENKQVEDENQSSLIKGIQIRKNLQETAFFYPHLTTDKNGNITFNFTVPEALTRWKLQLLAHNKELHSAVTTLETVTQKELMVTANAPRFLREGDKITLSAKISNLSDKKLQGLAQLILTDAVTGKPIDADLGNTDNQQTFIVDKGGNTSVSWNLTIPETTQAVQYKVVAKAGDFSDGEQNVLPVLSNRMLVTETLPMWVRSNQTKTFTLDKLKNQTSTTLSHHKLTLEVTSNPAWYAVQALPYLMEYPYECSEQTFARYYANTLASHIANSNSRIQEVFNAWKSSDALLSNLEKNQELKSLIIQETPWLRDAQSETEQKKRIALLFNLNKMKNEQEKAINKLVDFQMSHGSFPWFKGSQYPNIYITNHIASGFGHLKKLGASNFDDKTDRMLRKAIQFLDIEIADQYDKLLEQAEKIRKKEGDKKAKEFLEKNHLGYFQLQYLYMRSFFDDISIEKKSKKAVEYYTKQSATYWKDFNLLGKGQIALIHFRDGNTSVADKILKSLKENSITSEELGMYWKSNQPSWYWHQAPIETQALLIEAFSEIENDTKTVDELKVWLLKNKQVNQWKTTKATTEAVYALLLQGSDWISVTDMIEVTLGNTKIDPSKLENTKVEAGTGYFKTSWNGSEITPEMSTVSINKKGKGIAWGGLYWQYFEDLDKITSAETPLKLKKKLFKKVNSATGKELQEISNTTDLKVGDLVTVRIELRADRDMEFIHMKDMRAAAFEPVDVLSQYKWQDGLGYYQSTKDAATNFFFDRLIKGIHIFEYDVRVNNAGNFSTGIITIQSMYAPEFSSHSNGTRITVNNIK